MISQAILDRLTADPVLDGLLARHVGDASAPAIYTTIPVPRGAQTPYVVAYAANVAGVTEDTLDFAGTYSRVTRDVHAYTSRAEDGGGSASEVNAIAGRVRELFRRERLVLSGGAINLFCRANPSIAIDGEEHFGRVVSVDLLIAESAPTV
jgi:hypothetical protein